MARANIVGYTCEARACFTLPEIWPRLHVLVCRVIDANTSTGLQLLPPNWPRDVRKRWAFA
eukprot:2069098-Pyramimonas_sp.AAC.1